MDRIVPTNKVQIGGFSAQYGNARNVNPKPSLTLAKVPYDTSNSDFAIIGKQAEIVDAIVISWDYHS